MEIGAIIKDSGVLLPIFLGLLFVAIMLVRQVIKSRKDKTPPGLVPASAPLVPDEVILHKDVITDKAEIVHARVADNIKGTIYDTEIIKETADKIRAEFGTLGRQWDRYGRKVYALNRFLDDDGEIKLRPIKTPAQITNAPAALHNSLQQPEIGIIVAQMMKDDDKTFIEKYGVVLWWLAVMGFLGFMWANA